ncbi:MAG: ABC transporter permease [Candidatus Helarchaeota archaeon]
MRDFQSFKIQLKELVSASLGIAERQIIRIRRNKTILVGQFGIPLLILIGFGFGMSSWIQSFSGTNGTNVSSMFFDYLAVGVVLMSTFLASQFSAFAIVSDRELGFQNEILVSTAPRISVILGNSLAGAFRALYQGGGVLTLGILLSLWRNGGTTEISLNPLNWVIVGMLIVLTCLFVGGFMSFLSSLFENAESYYLISSLIGFPLFFLSDMFFPQTSLGIIPYFNPLNYATNSIRFFLLPSYAWSLPIHITILVLVCLAISFIIIATIVFTRTARK